VGHPLLQYFRDAAGGRFPPVDGGVTYLPALGAGFEAVVSFTGHAVIASRLGADELADLRLDGFGAALDPRVLQRLTGSGTVGVIDVTLAGTGTGRGGPPATNLWDDHARVAQARSLRDDVRVFGDERGFVTIASGLAGRVEMSIQTIDAMHDSGLGRRLIAGALGLVGAGEPLFAAVSPGNARSLRAFLSQGFVPLGSEVLIRPS
jgi:hypothetical protein